MSREIKFRIWDKKFKKWLTSGDGGTHCNSNWAIDPFTGKIIDYVECNDSYLPSPEREFYYESSKIICESPFVKQQYTGLKDKNSFEIYEGDILSYTLSNSEFTETVAWENNGWVMINSELDSSCSMSSAYLPTIVGNIFENPELLKA